MNYIYDVLINLNDVAYDFYDWNKTDCIEHIRKMPILKVESKILKELKEDDILLDHNVIDKIKDKTEVFNKDTIECIEFGCLFSDAMEVVALEFNSQGRIVGRSRLLVDEETEVIDVVSRLTENKINYQILKHNSTDLFKTRKEVEILKYIGSSLMEFEKQDLDKIKYLYYECFDEKEENIDIIISKMKQELNCNWKNVYPKIYDFFKLTSINK